MKAAAIRTVLTATFIFLMAPIVVVVVSSFNAVGVLSFPPQSFTTRWYYEIDPAYYQALTTSLIVATITVVIAVLVGVPGALALARGRFPGRDALNAICLSPLMISALVMGVAAFQFSLVIWDYFRLTLGGTIAGLVVGHLTFAIPFVVRSILAGHTRFDFSLEEAAQNSAPVQPRRSCMSRYPPCGRASPPALSSPFSFRSMRCRSRFSWGAATRPRCRSRYSVRWKSASEGIFWRSPP